jgi:ubiquinone/menaquinone biosynthesis C-methylase UbiE
VPRAFENTGFPYASAGAQVTVVDLSNKMLQLDEQEARRRGLQVRILETSMDDLSALRESQFDIVHQPVSTCYVPDVEAVYREVSRVMRPGGLYISQHKTPTSLQITNRDQQNTYVIGLEYYQQGPLPKGDDRSYREEGATEYLHRWEQLTGGLCRQGFVIEDLREPVRADPSAPVGHFRHRGRYVAPYVRIKARRVEHPAHGESPAAIWVP